MSGERVRATAQSVRDVVLRRQSEWDDLYRVAVKASQFCFQYPVSLVSTRAGLSHIIPRLPEDLDVKNVHAVLEPAKQIEAISNRSPGRRWVNPVVPKFAVANRSKYVNKKDGRPLYQLDTIHSETGPLTSFDVAKRILRTDGIFGFYRGVARTAALDLMNESLCQSLTPVCRQVYDTAICRRSGKEIKKSEGRFIKRLSQWFSSEEGRSAVANAAARLSASVLLYPISTINLRCTAYEPLDRRHLNFFNMARLTVIFDGPESFYRGLLPYLSVKASLTAGELVVSAIESTSPRKNASVFKTTMLKSIEPLLQIMTSSISLYGQANQVLSAIPGLAPALPEKQRLIGFDAVSS